MFLNLSKRITNVLVFIMLVCTMNPSSIARATSSYDQQGMDSVPEVIPASSFDESRPLSSIAPILATGDSIKLRHRLVVPKTLNSASNDVTDSSIVQTNLLGKATSETMAAPVISFDGIGFNGYSPSDANGDIGYSSVTGRKYYMQAVNISFQIWDVTNPNTITSLYGPALSNTLWSGFGGLCETHNDGDPIILFDHLAKRWMFSQFAFNRPNDFHQCIAVSTSADPTKTWHRYDFQYSTTKLNDYAKFGVWPDGYYMSVNQFDGSTDASMGAGAVVFDRTAMLNGLPATMIKFDIGAVVSWYGEMLPSDLDGPSPAVGSPNYFIEWDDSTWHDDPADTLRIWNFHVDWSIPANSSFGANASFDPNAKVATANLDSNMCSNNRDCIPQPGTTQKLDAIAFGQLMYRLQYRNFGSYQTLVGNQTVDATGADKAGVYWFELRNDGVGWGMNQQGVYAPDANNRWMGSAAMDKLGDIALGYSVASANTFPSVRYAGRLVSDPLSTLPQGEISLAVGSGSQTGTNRWGDYSMMTMDPTDDCTFWYTQEYYTNTSSSGWKTRIGSFRFPLCVHTISGNAGIAGVTLSYTDGTPKTVKTDSKGNYSLGFSVGWSGTVTVSKIGYSFTPMSRVYGNLQIDQLGENYTAQYVGGADTAGVFRPSNGLLYLKNKNDTGFADIAINYGMGGDYPVVGDWDGDGTVTIGIYRNGSFYLRNSNTLGFADWVFPFGQVGDQPIAGDWNGDGIDTIGIFRPSNGLFLLRNSNDAGPADAGSFFLGNVGDVGIAGDWNGDGVDTTGVFRPVNGIIFLKNTNTTGFADVALNYGIPGDKPVTGDWNGDGIDTIGVYRNGQFMLRDSNTIGFADYVFGLGNPGDMPIAGNWDALP